MRERAEKWLETYAVLDGCDRHDRREYVDSLTALLEDVRREALEEAVAAAELKSSPYSAFFRDKQGVGK